MNKRDQAERELLEQLGFPAPPVKVDGVILDAIWALLVRSQGEKLQNARAMAENLMKCPANEQYLGQTQAAAAQAIKDLADALELMCSGEWQL